MQKVYSILSKTISGTYVSPAPVILCDLLGVERLTSAYEHTGVARGISSVAGPVVAGKASMYQFVLFF